MPTYDYECTKCGHTFEAFQRMSDKPLARCPKCGSALRRLIGSGLGVIFKGSGFYTTDYKKSSTLTSGNGGAKEKDKASEKPSEKPKETASGTGSSEKKAAS